MKRVLASVLIALTSTTAAAQGYFIDGKEFLQKYCQEVGRLPCIGFVAAVSDVSQITGMSCISKGVTIGDVVDVAILYVRMHPRLWDRPAVFGVQEAITYAWPCEKQDRSSQPKWRMM
ncbi:MAG: Rap1a/Tai family immunity protein [Candidatus Sumerlaeia bacterium]|nr:Rap1a/Tai family immunity protein [Candidatus Sumerlaeia bacterium]